MRLLDRHAEPGGRASTWKKDGFTFDMGPSFYWMPDVFERWFNRFGERVDEHLDLRRLDPSYAVVFGKNDVLRIPSGVEAVKVVFERIEKGAAAALDRFLADAQVKYDLGVGDLVHKPSLRWSEYLTARTLMGLVCRPTITSLRRHVRRHFTDPRLRQVMEFPVLFLGASPQDAPALYSLMNHADMALGTWYPMGGFGAVVQAMVRIAVHAGVEFSPNSDVRSIVVDRGRAIGVEVGDRMERADAVLATADYHHVEQDLLAPEHRTYSAAYWESRVLAPAALLFFIGLNRKVDALDHHTLFFDAPFDQHNADIHDTPRWPKDPLFYVSRTSCTDPSTAPPGCENITVLIPIAPGLDDPDPVRERYFDLVMDRMEAHLGIDLRPHVVVKRDHCVREQMAEHHSYRGNAYGMANTLRQTGPWRPSLRSKKVKGLYFAGQLSVPGGGVPPALISGQVSADLAHRDFNRNR